MGKRFLCLILSIVIACATIGCSKQDLGNATLFDAADQSTSSAFSALTTAWFCQSLEDDPLSCHFTLQDPSVYHISFTEPSLCHLTFEDHMRTQKKTNDFLKQLKDINRSELSRREQLVYDVLLEYYNLEEKMEDYYYYQNLLSPTAGIPSSLPILLSAYDFHTKEDIICYLSLLEDFDIYFGQLYAYATEQANRHLAENRESLQQTIDFCTSFATFSEDHLLLSSFEKRIHDCSFLSEIEKNSYISKNSTVITNVVLPSYLSLSNQLSSLIDKSDTNGSLYAKEKGRSYYALLARQNSGTSESPYTLFQQISARRQKDLSQMADLFSHNPALASSISSYDCPLSTPEDMMEHLQNAIQNDFPSCEQVTVTIQQIAPQLQKTSAPAYYFIAPFDSHGHHFIFYNPNANIDQTTLFTTMAHEGFPGHLYQTAMSYQYGLEPVRCLLSFPAYTEGWATYAEYLSYQYAGLPEEVASVLACNDRVVLSLYASADIGIHYYGWNKDMLLDFFKKYGIHDENVIDQIYQLIVEDPANYLKYYVGYMNFASLEEEYRDAKKHDFSYMDFHKKILQTGPASFAILKQQLLDTL